LLEGFGGVGGLEGSMAKRRHQLAQHLAGVVIILHDQHAAR
jgi:hypothetical protein